MLKNDLLLSVFDAKIEEDIEDKVVDDACQTFLKILVKVSLTKQYSPERVDIHVAWLVLYTCATINC